MDAHVSLALALNAGPGTVAALLGAGASASAGLPTAWEVRQALIRRVALAKGDPSPADPEVWWSQQGGNEGYDGLLAQAAPTAEGRRDLLRGFFEPTEEERDRGEKRPGAAHHALARLVSVGAVKVILTLNFDRLIETALREAGVEPVVVESPSAIEGMEPLQHQQALVVHLHGDYLSPQTLNTPEELAEYPTPVNTFLDEVFDRYGLLVVGWSAAWDVALRARLQAARSPRYGTWWVDRFPLGEHAQNLATARRAAVAIGDAGQILAQTADAVQALREQRLQDPVGSAAAVSYAKRALSGANVAIGLHDTLRREADRVAALEAVATRSFPMGNVEPEYLRRREQILAGAAALAGLVATSAYWGDEKTDAWWLPLITRLVPRGQGSGATDLNFLRLGPALLLTYAAGVAASAASREDLVAHLAADLRIDWEGKSYPASTLLQPYLLWPEPGTDDELGLREYLRPLLQDNLSMGIATFEEAWERWSLICYLQRQGTMGGPARPLLLVDGYPGSVPAVERMRRRLRESHDGSGLLSHGNLGGSVQTAMALLDQFEEFVTSWVRDEKYKDLDLIQFHNTGPRYPGRPGLAQP